MKASPNILCGESRAWLLDQLHPDHMMHYLLKVKKANTIGIQFNG